MSTLNNIIAAFFTTSLHLTVSDITRERFEEFKAEIIELVACGQQNDPFPGQDASPCTKGLIFSHADVSLYDAEGSKTDTNYNLIGGLARLAFHDCGGIDPEKVKNGDTNDFTDAEDNGRSGGCNGCLGIGTNPAHFNLLDAAIIPLEPICDAYRADGMSRADCWALAATVALEWSAQNLALSRGGRFGGQIIEPALRPGDVPYYFGRSDCINGYDDSSDDSSDEEVDYAFSNPDGVGFEFPIGELGWSHMSSFFKSRFGWGGDSSDSSDETSGDYFTNRDIVALIAGAHSVGRGHEKISGHGGAWDFSTDVLDNAFVSTLFGEETVTAQFGISQNMAQVIRNPTEPNAKPSFSLQAPFHIQMAFGLTQEPFVPQPLDTLNMNLNTDLSIVYDLSWFIENGKKNEIDCNTRADLVCGDGQIILTALRGESSNFNAGANGEQLGEQYVCGENEDCCQYKQCPIQCQGGIDRFNALVDGDALEGLEDDSDCPAALAKRYSMRLQQSAEPGNRNMGLDFAKAFEKMITIGYKEEDGQVLLQTIPEAQPFSGSTDGGVVSLVPYIIALFAVALLISIGINIFCCLRKRKEAMSIANVEMTAKVMQEIDPSEIPVSTKFTNAQSDIDENTAVIN